jgi:probable rRNA maturation factor
VIEVSVRQRLLPVRAAEVRAVVAAAFAEQDEQPRVAVRVLDDAGIRAINARWLGHDWPTDAIAFDYGDDPEARGPRGEVFVSAETALREARARRREPRRELLLYVAHGALHLLGWDDGTPARRRAMNARAAAVVRRALAPRKAPPSRKAKRPGRRTAARRSVAQRSVAQRSVAQRSVAQRSVARRRRR